MAKLRVAAEMVQNMEKWLDGEEEEETPKPAPKSKKKSLADVYRESLGDHVKDLTARRDYHGTTVEELVEQLQALAGGE